MKPARWSPGDVVAMREVWRGKVWAARPMVVVRDDPGLQAFWFPRGTPWRRPRALDGSPLRVPTQEWSLAEDEWDRNDNLILVEPGAAHAVHLFWSADAELLGWYVNLQRPLVRTSVGFDYMDLALDVVAAPDLSTWRWKDEDDLAEFVTHGLLTAGEAREVRAEGEAVLARMHDRAAPFNDGWPAWRPNPAWPVPTLSVGWDRLQA